MQIKRLKHILFLESRQIDFIKRQLINVNFNLN